MPSRPTLTVPFIHTVGDGCERKWGSNEATGAVALQFFSAKNAVCRGRSACRLPMNLSSIHTRGRQSFCRHRRRMLYFAPTS